MHFVIAIGALGGAIAVTFGAFAAHALAGSVPPADLAAFETGARYHLVHALAMVAAGLLGLVGGRTAALVAAILFAAGIVLFSGSLYVLGFTGSRALVLVTPVGGLFLIAGWIALAVAGLRIRPAGGGNG